MERAKEEIDRMVFDIFDYDVPGWVKSRVLALADIYDIHGPDAASDALKKLIEEHGSSVGC